MRVFLVVALLAVAVAAPLERSLLSESNPQQHLGGKAAVNFIAPAFWPYGGESLQSPTSFGPSGLFPWNPNAQTQNDKRTPQTSSGTPVSLPFLQRSFNVNAKRNAIHRSRRPIWTGFQVLVGMIVSISTDKDQTWKTGGTYSESNAEGLMNSTWCLSHSTCSPQPYITFNGESFPKGSLVARIGTGLWFYVGSRRTVVAEDGGILQIACWDDQSDDNFGSIDASVSVYDSNAVVGDYLTGSSVLMPCSGNVTMTSASSTPSSVNSTVTSSGPVSSTSPRTFKVKAVENSVSANPLKTGLQVSVGEVLTFTAPSDNLWSISFSPVGTSNADGLPGPTFMFGRFGVYLPLNSLVARIGSGQWFLVGTHSTYTASTSGELQFAHWDIMNYENSGSVDVTVKIAAAGNVDNIFEVRALENCVAGGTFLQTGRTVREGDLIVFSADSAQTWSAGPSITTSANGMAGRLYFGIEIASLVARIGSGDWFKVGINLAVTADTSGEIALAFWDSVCRDNAGAIRVAIEVVTPTVETVVVFARDHCVADGTSLNTTIVIQKNDIVTLSVDVAQVWFSAPETGSNADGQAISWKSNEGLSFPIGALVGRVGCGPWFRVGTSLVFSSEVTGQLFLAFWDSLCRDNIGNITVVIQHPKHSPTPTPAVTSTNRVSPSPGVQVSQESIERPSAAPSEGPIRPPQVMVSSLYQPSLTYSLMPTTSLIPSPEAQVSPPSLPRPPVSPSASRAPAPTTVVVDGQKNCANNGREPLHTNVFVTTGSFVVFTALATDTWSTSQSSASTAAGASATYTNNGATFPLGALVGRIGDGSWFQIGLGTVINARECGEIQLANWCERSDTSSGSVHVTFQVAETQLYAFSIDARINCVSGGRVPFNTTISVNAGDVLTLFADPSQAWYSATTGLGSNADGQAVTWAYGGVEFPIGKLVGRVGDSPWFAVGTQKVLTGTASRSGFLELAYWDLNSDDNSGKISVVVQFPSVSPMSRNVWPDSLTYALPINSDGSVVNPQVQSRTVTVVAMRDLILNPLKSRVTVAVGQLIRFTVPTDMTWKLGSCTANAYGCTYLRNPWCSANSEICSQIHETISNRVFPRAALVGRIGTGDWFLVGQRKLLYASQAGEIELAFWGIGATQAEGQMLVNIDLIQTPQQTKTDQILVTANLNCASSTTDTSYNSGVNVKGGDIIKIVVTTNNADKSAGWWNVDNARKTNGYGMSKIENSVCVAPSCADTYPVRISPTSVHNFEGALVARIGTAGDWFPVGTGVVFEASQAGTLQFASWITNCNAAFGSITVSITHVNRQPCPLVPVGPGPGKEFAALFPVFNGAELVASGGLLLIGLLGMWGFGKHLEGDNPTPPGPVLPPRPHDIVPQVVIPEYTRMPCDGSKSGLGRIGGLDRERDCYGKPMEKMATVPFIAKSPGANGFKCKMSGDSGYCVAAVEGKPLFFFNGEAPDFPFLTNHFKSPFTVTKADINRGLQMPSAFVKADSYTFDSVEQYVFAFLKLLVFGDNPVTSSNRCVMKARLRGVDVEIAVLPLTDDSADCTKTAAEVKKQAHAEVVWTDAVATRRDITPFSNQQLLQCVFEPCHNVPDSSFKSTDILSKADTQFSSFFVLRTLDCKTVTKDCNTIGRLIQNFDNGQWSPLVKTFVKTAIVAKLADAKLKSKFCSLKDFQIFDADPKNLIWGLGLAVEAPATPAITVETAAAKAVESGKAPTAKENLEIFKSTGGSKTPSNWQGQILTELAQEVCGSVVPSVCFRKDFAPESSVMGVLEKLSLVCPDTCPSGKECISQ